MLSPEGPRMLEIPELYPENSREEIAQISTNIQPNKSIASSQPLQTKSGRTVPVETNIFQGSWKEPFLKCG